MDRIGFDLIDAQYQKELEVAKQRITDEMTVEFHGDVYSATDELNEEHKEHEKTSLQQRIDAAIALEAQRIGAAHFPDFGGREEALAAVIKEEKLQERAEQLKNDFVRNGQSQDRNHGR